MKKAVIAVLLIALLCSVFYIGATPAGRAMWNSWMFQVQKADDATRYTTRKTVEDSCRSMMASYEADRLVWEQYADSDNPEKQAWGEQAKMRANKTAASYNEYVLKNSFVWDGNIPNDIAQQLHYIK